MSFISSTLSAIKNLTTNLIQNPAQVYNELTNLIRDAVRNPADHVPLITISSTIGSILTGLSIRSLSIHTYRSFPSKALKETVVITGATSGIGRELAVLFARDGYNIIMVARSVDELDRTRDLLLSVNQSIEVFYISKDLVKPESAREIFDEVYNNPKYSHLYINNLINDAGVVMRGEFLRMDLERQVDMIDLNVSALTKMFHLFASEFCRRVDNGSKQKFRILNLASFASFTPNPNMACYGATKSYIHYLTLAVHEELKARYGSQITVSALNPGLVNTAAIPKSGTEHSILYKLGQYDTPERAAKIGYHTMMRGERYAIVGWMNGIIVYLSQAVLPYWLQAKCAKIGTSDWNSLKISNLYKDQLQVNRGNEGSAGGMAFGVQDKPADE